MARAPGPSVLLYVAFLLSGATALVYEVVWSKYLALLMGSTSLAHAIVLATFMAGLALGNAVFGRVADRKGLDTLRVYALLELGVGLACLLFPPLFGRLSRLYMALAQGRDPTSPLNVLLKSGLSAASLLLPCFLMGGTLPVLVKHVTVSLRDVGRLLSWLYFVNTVGAVGGCLLAGFYVVEAWGLESGMLGTSFVNVGIGLLFYGLRRRRGAPRETVHAATRAATDPQQAAMDAGLQEAGFYTRTQTRLALACIGVAGGLSMLYELVWIRLLILSMGGTVHSFSTAVAGFIFGIALGSLLATGLLRRPRNALALLGLSELGVGLWVLLSLPAQERLPFAFFRVGSLFAHTPDNYAFFLVSQVVFAVLVMLVPAAFIGLALPLAARVCVDGLDRLGRRVGDVFSVNTLGNVVGAILTGFLVLPSLGLEKTLIVGGILSGLLGIALLYSWQPRGREGLLAGVRHAVGAEGSRTGGRLWTAALAVLGLVVLIRVWTYPSWDPRVLQFGLHRWELGHQFPSWDAFKAVRNQVRFLYSRDGSDACITVEENADERLVRVNGKPDASSGMDVPIQLMVGHLGMLMHPQPKRAMVVGLASGATVGAMLRHPGVTVDVAEISSDMAPVPRFFEAINDGVLNDPRMTLAILDGREFLLLSREKYDVIASEPTNVWVPGVAGLFTEDFFSVVKSRLRPGGLFVQWLQLSSNDDEIVASVVASLGRVFPYVSLWVIDDSDLLFLAGFERPPFDPDGFAKRFSQVSPGRGIRSLSNRIALFSDPVLFLASQVATHETVRVYWPAQSAAPYRDAFPRMEFQAARAQFVGRHYLLLAELDERVVRLGAEPLFLEEYLARHAMDQSAKRRLMETLGSFPDVYVRLARALALQEVLESGARPMVKLPHFEGLLAHALRARQLGAELDGSFAAATPDRCDAYLEAHGTALAAAVSVFSVPSWQNFEARIEACAARNLGKAQDLRIGIVKALAPVAPVRAMVHLTALDESGVLDQLEPRTRADLLVTGARLSLRVGRRDEALLYADRALKTDSTNLAAARLARALMPSSRL